MRKRAIIGAVVMTVAAVAFTSQQTTFAAATVNIIGTTSCGSSGAIKCWTSSDGNTIYSARAAGSPASVSVNGKIDLTAGDSISFTSSSNHNIVACLAGSTVNGWLCGDPITSYSTSGLTPGGTYASNGAGAPAAVGGSGGSGSGTITFSTAGTFYFYCTVSSMHYYDGMYAKVVVASAETTTTAAATTTVAPAATTTTAVTATTAAPTVTTATSTTPVTVKVTAKAVRKGSKVTLSGSAPAGATVTIQKLSGKKWSTAGRATASSSGAWSWTGTAKAVTSWRASAGGKTSSTVKK